VGLFQAREAYSSLSQIKAIRKIIRLSREARSYAIKSVIQLKSILIYLRANSTAQGPITK
jgi:hypothetical protein